MKNKPRIILTGLSILSGILIGYTSLTGFLTPGFYALETLDWQVQSTGQDLVNLCVVLPVLFITVFLMFKGLSKSADLLAGTLLYLVYTYMIYCFDIHFNRFFLWYCAILGLCFYLLVYFFYQRSTTYAHNTVNNRYSKLIAVYFLILSVLFCFLWLSDVVPAIFSGGTPGSLTSAGLLTNPVHVLDLSVFLPGIFITGILILKNNKFSILLIPVILTFCILMDITITVLTIVMINKQIAADFSIAIVMGALALLSLMLLILNLKR